MMRYVSALPLGDAPVNGAMVMLPSPDPVVAVIDPNTQVLAVMEEGSSGPIRESIAPIGTSATTGLSPVVLLLLAAGAYYFFFVQGGR